MIDAKEISSLLPFLEQGLVDEIAAKGQQVVIPSHQQIVREGQYIKSIPVVLQGLLKVITSHGDKDMLLYYIQPGDSCIMSFAFSLSNEPSNIAAFTETESTLLLLDAIDVKKWLYQYPSLNKLFLDLYNHRYRDLVETIGELIYEKLDVRIYNYLLERAKATGTDIITLTHREIADDLASSREVISRMMKKLEADGKVKQLPNGIQIF